MIEHWKQRNEELKESDPKMKKIWSAKMNLNERKRKKRKTKKKKKKKKKKEKEEEEKERRKDSSPFALSRV